MITSMYLLVVGLASDSEWRVLLAQLEVFLSLVRMQRRLFTAKK